ncbi:PxKF domain-containing protein [Lysobacter yangpyeongensis]|uniref:non-specific serine/threonine protein kinase n=1 Tax=Lysobacter yangpyeongensis TaxID=346182 RepID=A0ABW0SN02_9GAMM
MLQCFGSPMVSENLPIEPLRQFDVGYEHGCGVLALDGHAHCWGREVDGKTLVPPGLFRNLSGGLMHSCGVRADGTGACWGYDGDGQTVPVLAPERAFLAIQAGERHSCGFDSGLHIRCWGLDAELPYDPNEPGQLPEFATFRALSVGAHHSCAIRTSGRLFCWGADWSGQLQNIPQGTFVAVSAGSSHTCAIRTDGTRECWGEPWMTPHLELDPESVPGVRPGEYLNVQFQLRSDGPLPVQASTYAIVAGTLPWSFFLDPNGVLHGSAYQPGRYPITVEGRDQNGFAARREVVVSIDDTPPLIQAQIAGTLGDNGWYISPVNLSWLVSEPESSIRYQDGCDPVQVQWDTQGMDFHCFADSVGGNTVESVTLKVDTQAPIVSVQSFTADGALATVTFEGHDSLSGLAGFECALDGGAYAACASPLVRTFAPGLHELLVRAVDAAGNRSEPAYKNWVTDATPPQVSASVTGPLGANGWYVGNVQISWQVSDAESAVGGIGCNTVQLTVDTPGASFTCTATSAGGTTVRTVTVKRDATAPTLLPSVNPGTLLLNSPQQAKANGSDALSGIAGETCAPLATASVGAKSVACSVTDAAGNSASASTGYRVVYGFVGFSSPVQNPSVLNVSKASRSVPLRWRVVDAQGAPVANLTAAGVNATAIACPVTTESRISTYGGSNGQLRNLGNGYYQLDWMAANSLRGSCRRLELDLGDGEARSAWFKFN